MSSLPQLFMSFRPYHHLHFIKQTSPVLNSIDTKQQGWQGLIIRRSQFSCKYFQADSSPKTLDITARSVTRPTLAQSMSTLYNLPYITKPYSPDCQDDCLYLCSEGVLSVTSLLRERWSLLWGILSIRNASGAIGETAEQCQDAKLMV